LQEVANLWTNAALQAVLADLDRAVEMSLARQLEIEPPQPAIQRIARKVGGGSI
jgi:hypothetical protein